MHLMFLQNTMLLTLWSSPKLLKSCSGCRFLVLQECGDFFIYFILNFLANIHPLSYMVALSTVLWPYLQNFPKHSSPELVVWDLLSEVPSLAPISSNFSSVSIFRFLSGFLSSSDPVVFSLLTKLCVLCLLGNRSPGNWYRNIMRHFLENSYLK